MVTKKLQWKKKIFVYEPIELKFGMGVQQYKAFKPDVSICFDLWSTKCFGPIEGNNAFFKVQRALERNIDRAFSNGWATFVGNVEYLRKLYSVLPDIGQTELSFCISFEILIYSAPLFLTSLKSPLIENGLFSFFACQRRKDSFRVNVVPVFWYLLKRRRYGQSKCQNMVHMARFP